MHRVTALAPQHPGMKNKEPFASLLRGDIIAALEDGEHGILEVVAATHSGMTTEEFKKYREGVGDWPRPR
jgi:hypothetical protein